ncbi:MAG: hypothetical protein KBD85_05755 [Elusimicrobia bacterium]|nr:hypothetical protein [Elusimicrobiota bacterium]
MAKVVKWAIALFLGFSGLKSWAEFPNHRWAALATYGGAGLRYALSPRISGEGRVLMGDGLAVSLRGSYLWEKESWKIRPLAGAEVSVLSPFRGEGHQGAAFLLFVGGEVRLAKRWTFQVDMGPAVLRMREEDGQKEEWDYQNVLNVSLNYYFGKKVKGRGKE